MGSEKGRELKTGLACATFWVERLLWPLPHLYAVLSYLARYCLCHRLWQERLGESGAVGMARA